MSEHVEDRPFNPKPPPYGLLLAVLLEVCIVAVFFYHRSMYGLLLCLIYFYFSAARSFMFPPRDE